MYPYADLKLVSENTEQYLNQRTEGVIERQSKWRGASQLLLFFHRVLVGYINENSTKQVCMTCGISRHITIKNVLETQSIGDKLRN